MPDVPAVFTALGGDTPINGTPFPRFVVRDDASLSVPATGFKDDTRRIDDVDWTNGAFRVQFIPVPETPVEDLPADDLTVFYILATNGNAIHNGTGTLTLEAHRLLARHRDSKNANRHILALADLYAELTAEYVESHPPESLLFEPHRFRELVDAASRLYQRVAAEDGTTEKLEAARRLEAFLAFALRVDRDRFTP